MPNHPPDDSHRLRCAHCGYDLHGLPGNVCSECGHTFDPHAAATQPNAGLARTAAAIAVVFAVVGVSAVIKGSLEEVGTWGRPSSCHRAASASGGEIAVVILAHLVTMGMLWHARSDRACRRIVRAALLAIVTAWIAALVILEHA